MAETGLTYFPAFTFFEMMGHVGNVRTALPTRFSVSMDIYESVFLGVCVLGGVLSFKPQPGHL